MADPDKKLANVSVIVPAYRAAGTIDRTLASIAAQTVRPRQVIVVDDGSEDGTFEAAQAWTERMGDISIDVYRQNNQGAGAARNLAIRQATGTLIAFLDADDEWLPEKLERTLSYFSDPEMVLVSHDALAVEPGREYPVHCARRFKESSKHYVDLYRKGYIGTSMTVVRRNAVIAAGGFDESLRNAQDFDLWLTLLARRDVKFLIFPETLTRYHVTAGSVMSFTQRRLDCTLTIAQRHFPALKCHPGSPWHSLWFRIVAVHYEAMMAYRRQNRIVEMIWTVIRLPMSLITTTLAVLTRQIPPRPRFLGNDSPISPP